MEPVAHYGLREGEVINSVSIRWTNGLIEEYKVNEINNTIIYKQGI